MDSILDIFEYDEEEELEVLTIGNFANTKKEDVSLWLKEGSKYIPYTNSILLSKLDPGMYIVEYDRESGLHCKKSSIVSDELFIFSNSIIENLIIEVESFWDKKDLFKSNNLIHKRGIILEGPQGTGKSSIISLLSEKVVNRGGIVFIVNNSNDLNLYINFLKNNFRLIEPDTPIITIIEDLDKYAEDKVILDFLDGKTNIDHHLVITTTNNSKKIPDTFLRPSRIDLRILVSFPNYDIRKEFLLKKGFLEGEELDYILQNTDSFSLADLKELYISTSILGYSISDAIDKIKNPKEKKDYLSSSFKTSKLGFIKS